MRSAAITAFSVTSFKTGPGDDVSLTGTVKAAGLGGDPYRDGSYAYYIGEKSSPTTPRVWARSCWPALKWRTLRTSTLARGDTVLVDAWFNSQQRARRIRPPGLLPLQMERPEQQRVLPLRPYLPQIRRADSTLYQAPTLARY